MVYGEGKTQKENSNKSKDGKKCWNYNIMYEKRETKRHRERTGKKREWEENARTNEKNLENKL